MPRGTKVPVEYVHVTAGGRCDTCGLAAADVASAWPLMYRGRDYLTRVERVDERRRQIVVRLHRASCAANQSKTRPRRQAH